MAANGPDTAHQQQAFSDLFGVPLVEFADACRSTAAGLAGREYGRSRFPAGAGFPDRWWTRMFGV